MIFYVFHDTKLAGGTDGAYLAKPLIALFGFTLTRELSARAGAHGRLLRGAGAARRHLPDPRIPAALDVRPCTGRITDNKSRMRALGFTTYRCKLAAFVIAGVLAGVAGICGALHTAT